MRQAACKMNREWRGIALESRLHLRHYAWPGNIRELQNVIERSAILSAGEWLEVDLLSPTPSGAQAETGLDGEGDDAVVDNDSLAAVQRRHIIAVLQKTRGVIEGPEGAARVLNMKPSTVRYRMKKLGIARGEYH